MVKKLLIITCLICVIVWHQYTKSYPIIVFCDVGQGSATLLQMQNTQVLIDTGPNRSVLACLGKHMPFMDTHIEYVIITHPQKDHNGGLYGVQRSYSIGEIIPESSKEKKQYILEFSSITCTIKRASLSSNNVNESAYVTTVSTPHHVVFLSSDITGTQLADHMPPSTTILLVPHHGSRTGIYTNSFTLAHPALAVISAGKQNTYGHPHPRTLEILKAKNISIWRTDLQGELVLKL